MKNKKNIISIILFAILIIGGLYLANIYVNSGKKEVTKVQKSNPKKIKAQTPKEVQAPNFKLKDLNDNEVSLSDYKGKKNVYLNFWATWCPPCRAEMPDIEKLYQETKDKDIVILAVNSGEDSETVKKFIKENNYQFKVLVDSEGTASKLYDVTSIPRSIFIDKKGNIKAARIGAISKAEMDSYIKMFK